jgi:hypothetical protein
MSNIDKQALREKFEAWWEVNYHNGNPPRFGWEHWRDGDGYKVDDDESELDGMWESWQAAHSSKLEAAEKRNAELSEFVRHVKKCLVKNGEYAPLSYESIDTALGIHADGNGGIK